MGRRYATTGAKVSAAGTTQLVLTSSATMRPRLYEWIWGSATAPADAALELALLRFTASGTGTAVTPKPIDPTDPVSSCSAQENLTVEPTYALITAMQEIGVNQQATWRWVTAPSEGIAMPALAANGLGLKFVTVSSGTPTCQATLYHDE